MHKDPVVFNRMTFALSLCGGLALGISADAGSLGGLDASADLTIGGGEVADVDLSLGKARGLDATATITKGAVVNADLSAGGSRSNTGVLLRGGAGIDALVDHGRNDRSNNDGGAAGSNRGNPVAAVTRAEPTDKAMPVRRLLPGDFIGVAVVSADGLLVGEVVDARIVNGKIKARVSLADTLGVGAEHIVLTLGKSTASENVIRLSMSRDRFVASVRNG